MEGNFFTDPGGRWFGGMIWMTLLVKKKSAYNAGRPGFDPWIGKIPRRKGWQPTPVFLPGESHGQRSLAGYNP